MPSGARFDWRRRLNRAVHYGAACAISAVAIGIGWWAAAHREALDLTANARHSLVPASIQALAALPAAPIVSAYIAPNHRARPQIVELVARYQRYRPAIQLRFIEPTHVANQAEARSIRDGELTITAAGRSESVAGYTEKAFTHALLRLLQRDTQFIAFVTGHGERSPLGNANFDFGHWHEVLKTRGYRAQELNLAELAAVPENTARLVLASPQLDYLPGEITSILDHVARGGNLLWLVEPDQPRSLDALAGLIGFERVPATVVDPLATALGIDNPAFAIVAKYPAHPALRGLSAASVFPYATPLAARTSPGWRASRLLETSAKAWGETAALHGAAFDPEVDYPAPLAFGLAMTRPRSGVEQRLVVLGDGDFLSNTYIGNSGNQDLGTRLVDWLTMNDAMIEIETRLAPDVSLDLARWQQAVIGFGFLVALPLAFALNGILIGWRRHRA